MKTDLAKRLSQARHHAGLTQAEAADRCGWSNQSRIGNYESTSSQREPRLDEIELLAKIYGVSFSWLATGTGSMQSTTPTGINEEPAQYGQPIARKIPLLTWKEIAGNTSKKTDGESILVDHASSTPFFCALKVHGDSMVNPHGKPSIPEDAIIIADREAVARSGDLVIVKIGDQEEAIFKQLVIDGGKRYLKSLNPLYPLIALDKQKSTLLGVVKQYIMKL